VSPRLPGIASLLSFPVWAISAESTQQPSSFLLGDPSRLTLLNTTATRVQYRGGAPSAETPLVFDQWFGVMPDGSLESIRTDSTRRLAWYRQAPGSSQVVRLGDAPIRSTAIPIISDGAHWESSNDGRRFVVVKSVDRPDIYLLRNFGELLKR